MISFNIINSADQKFSTILNNRRVTLKLRYNPSINRWAFDLAIDGDYVLHGRRIIRNIDLIQPFNFGIGLIFSFSFHNEEPGRDELIDGRVKLYNASEIKHDAMA